MQTILAFAVLVFLLGLFFGLPYHAAYKRRQALSEEENPVRAKEKKEPTSLDKSLFSS
jgi:hypothetical protein